MRIRSARRSDLPVLQDIERAAGEPFRALGMAFVADDDPPPLDLLESYRQAGRCWVATDPLSATGDRPLGYVLADPVDDALHIEQVSVDPAAARRGIGRDLIAHLAALAARRGMTALTLTTFTDVPWNAPYYARIGFRVLAEGELTDGLRAIRAEEAQHGLDRWPRVCMRRELSPVPRPSPAPKPAKTPPVPDTSGAADDSGALAVSGGA
ncbi:GCN5 family acetyltransferase [Streptomyces sp. TSRI0445]|uniref:GNAT family N-acetyltransferase n=1 Tax=Streptomyces TaxID=1883 RepID=UPI0005CB0B50|nr:MULTISPECIES: GNAT family N-acetyltransferase [Streptomyces]PPA39117.1 GNAT family N-acetyltransferase [Streptomyces griseus]RAN16513.1 GCN5 family acetyltransferase [Streptomyces badius]AWL85320.1 GNAT family N-acetyltransferase [Streptomyces globisporus]OKI66281.1 GCN5 family acetyltransferase [Streptomyces sp. TSRI0445]RAN24372.1 GCN5 family acetyltransferase [Streptomyces badius]